MKTRIRSLILAMLLVLSMATSSLAAGAGSDAAILLRAECKSDEITLSVYLTADNATNGRVKITYDQDYVALVDARTGGDWIADVNSERDGEVFFAWAGSDLSSNEEVLTLEFQVITEEYVDVTFKGVITELYIDALNLIGDSRQPHNSVSVTVGDAPEVPDEPGEPTPPPVIPDPPVNPDPGPTPPVNPNPGTTPPVDPTPGEDDKDDEEDVLPGIDLDVPELTTARYNAIVAKYPDAKDHWAEENIVKAINAGLFNGTGENTFSPDGVVTRGMFVTLLYRLCGEPAVSGNANFTDVSSAQYYADAVAWASANGIVNGMSATEFAPDNEVTREQMVTMLYRFAQFIGDERDETGSLSGFGDSGKLNDWAEEAMSWAVANGFINGSNGNLNPGDVSNRAQIATVLVRYAGL